MKTQQAFSRPGSIAVPGASGQVGKALCRRLAAFPNEVRPLGRGDDLRSALADAAVVIHLAGTLAPRRPNTYRAANLETVRAMVDALPGSAVERIVFLSFATADSASPNAYLRYKGFAEELLEGSGVPSVIFRCNHIIGPPEDPGPTAAAFLARKGRVRLLGSGQQRLAPVLRDDVVEFLVRAALDPTARSGCFQLAGPETFTASELAQVLNGSDVRVTTTPRPIARLLGRVIPSLTPELVDVMLSDAFPTGAQAPPFQLETRRLAELWAPRSVAVVQR